jgi:hypothetical protein
MPDGRIVAVGLLTQRDVEVLGTGFHRLLPVSDDDPFAELLAKLNEFEAVQNPSRITFHDVARKR